MNSVFSASRFFKYLKYDLLNAKNNYWISILILGLSPVAFFVFYELFSLLINGKLVEYSIVVQTASYFLSYVCLFVSFPVKAYGKLTSMREGSEWVLIPVSVFEKWLSMIVVTCFVLPLVFYSLFLGSDLLMSSVLPLYGDSIIRNFQVLTAPLEGLEQFGVSYNVPLYLYLNYVENILIFTLGAIVFKRSKTAKTILCYIAFGVFVSIISLVCLGRLHFSEDELRLMVGNGSVDEFARLFKLFSDIIYATFTCLLAFLCYLRMRTIKH